MRQPTKRLAGFAGAALLGSFGVLVAPQAALADAATCSKRVITNGNTVHKACAGMAFFTSYRRAG